MSLVIALLAFAAAAQPAPTPAPRGPVALPADTAPAWTLTAGTGGCSARVALAGGAMLEVGFFPGLDENYFGMWDPAWRDLRDGRSFRAALRFAPGEEEAGDAGAGRSARWGGRTGLFLLPARGEERLRRIGRFGTFELVVGERRLGTYVLPQAEAGMARLLACARAAAASAPSGQGQGVQLNVYFSTDDYPREALRRREEGTVLFSVLYGADGRVADCVVTGSSGSPSLDQTTCRIVRERVRVRPARDAQGNAVPRRDEGMAVTWSLPTR